MFDFLKNVPPKKDADLVREIGVFLCGEKWQSGLARMTGIPQTTLSGLVRGVTQLNSDQRDKLSDAIAAWKADLKRKRAQAMLFDIYLGIPSDKDNEG